jgi:hypothetical protein
MIEWRHDPSSAYRTEQAIVGDFKLVAFAIPPDDARPKRIIMWEVFGPPGWRKFLAAGEAESFEAAKAAAELTSAKMAGESWRLRF